MKNTLCDIADTIDRLGMACAAVGCVVDSLAAQNKNDTIHLGLHFIATQMDDLIDSLRDMVEQLA